MPVRVRLIHWNRIEARELAGKIRTAGYFVDYAPFTPKTIKELNKHPPKAVVIDLSRLPSQGRDVAANLLQFKLFRTIPFIFVDGDPEKVNGIKRIFPNLIYTDVAGLALALRKGIVNPPDGTTLGSVSAFQAYRDVPLAKKLGLKEDKTAWLIDAPPNFETMLGTLPSTATITRRRTSNPALLLWFVKTTREMERRISSIVKDMGTGRLWIIWPKKTGELETNLSQEIVRKAGLALGLVDYKVCSVDKTWSGLLFTKRSES